MTFLLCKRKTITSKIILAICPNLEFFDLEHIHPFYASRPNALQSELIRAFSHGFSSRTVSCG